MDDRKQEGMVLEKGASERGEAQVGEAMHSRKEHQGTPGPTTTQEGTSCKRETCPTWQLGAGLDGVLSAEPHLTACVKASSADRGCSAQTVPGVQCCWANP